MFFSVIATCARVHTYQRVLVLLFRVVRRVALLRVPAVRVHDEPARRRRLPRDRQRQERRGRDARGSNTTSSCCSKRPSTQGPRTGTELADGGASSAAPFPSKLRLSTPSTNLLSLSTDSLRRVWLSSASLAVTDSCANHTPNVHEERKGKGHGGKTGVNTCECTRRSKTSRPTALESNAVGPSHCTFRWCRHAVELVYVLNQCSSLPGKQCTSTAPWICWLVVIRRKSNE